MSPLRRSELFAALGHSLGAVIGLAVLLGPFLVRGAAAHDPLTGQPVLLENSWFLIALGGWLGGGGCLLLLDAMIAKRTLSSVLTTWSAVILVSDATISLLATHQLTVATFAVVALTTAAASAVAVTSFLLPLVYGVLFAARAVRAWGNLGRDESPGPDAHSADTGSH